MGWVGASYGSVSKQTRVSKPESRIENRRAKLQKCRDRGMTTYPYICMYIYIIFSIIIWWYYIIRYDIILPYILSYLILYHLISPYLTLPYLILSFSEAIRLVLVPVSCALLKLSSVAMNFRTFVVWPRLL